MCADGSSRQLGDDGGIEQCAVPGSRDNEDDIERSVPLSSLAWEAYELNSELSKSLKGFVIPSLTITVTV